MTGSQFGTVWTPGTVRTEVRDVEDASSDAGTPDWRRSNDACRLYAVDSITLFGHPEWRAKYQREHYKTLYF